MPVSDVWLSEKQPKQVLARDLICYWATSNLGITQSLFLNPVLCQS
ncbi:MAG: hypothetical protein WA151_13405 [Desulfatirhabdiaceae bacterium]